MTLTISFRFLSPDIDYFDAAIFILFLNLLYYASIGIGISMSDSESADISSLGSYS